MAGGLEKAGRIYICTYGSLTDLGIALQRVTGRGRQDEDVIASPFARPR